MNILKEARQSLPGYVTQKDIAKELGVSYSWISYIENQGRKSPKNDLVQKMAQAYRLDPFWILLHMGILPDEIRSRIGDKTIQRRFEKMRKELAEE